MLIIKKIILFIILIIIFSIFIFIILNYVGLKDYENKIIEEKFIEIGKIEKVDLKKQDTKNNLKEDLLQKEKQKTENIYSKTGNLSFNSGNKNYSFIYSPNSFTNKNLVEKNYQNKMEDFLNFKAINLNLNFLENIFFEERIDTRGKMKDKKINIFDPISMGEKESLSVFIHEFGHFFDLYILKRNLGRDISDKFYDISWESSFVIKSGQKSQDFVSGYAMTNKYEDFAESFNYYILHNYDFFGKYIFKNSEFKTDFFKSTKKVLNYYRDTTKIDFSIKKFLQYIKNNI